MFFRHKERPLFVWLLYDQAVVDAAFGHVVAWEVLYEDVKLRGREYERFRVCREVFERDAERGRYVVVVVLLDGDRV